MTPVTRYAKTADGVHIAYQVVGDGPVDMVFVMGWVTNLEVMWEDPDFARFLERWRAVTTGAIQARAYEPSRPAAHLIRDFLLVLGVGAPAATVVAEQTPVLNVGERRRPGLMANVADALLMVRFARANARLRRLWHVDLTSA